MVILPEMLPVPVLDIIAVLDELDNSVNVPDDKVIVPEVSLRMLLNVLVPVNETPLELLIVKL